LAKNEEKKPTFKVDLLKDGKCWVTEREVGNKEHAEQVAKALNEALRPDQKNLKYVVVEKEA
jgi:hypothetical protein